MNGLAVLGAGGKTGAKTAFSTEELAKL